METSLIGVYSLRNIKTGDTYVGATQNLFTRERLHRWCIKARKASRPYNIGFANAGKEDVEFKVLEYISMDQPWTVMRTMLAQREREWIHKLLPNLNSQHMPRKIAS